MWIAAHAVLFTIVVWWFTTGAIIYLDGLPRHTFAVSMGLASVLFLLALHAAFVFANDGSVTAAFVGFAIAIVAWGWNEMGFLMGLITGPRTTESPRGARGLARLGPAIQAIAYHEIAIGLTGLALWLVSAAGSNHVAIETFGLLWIMRLSAKINVYLGVPNITEEFLPPHLAYLKSYFRTRAMNAMFPVSVTGLTLLSTHYVAQTLAAPTPFEVAAGSLLATITILGLVEHWFMVLPIPSTALWKWSLGSHVAQADAVASHLAVIPSASLAKTAFGDPTLNVSHLSPLSPAIATVVPFPVKPSALSRRRT